MPNREEAPQSLPPGASAPEARKGRKRRWYWISFGVLVLLLAGSGLWWYSNRTIPPQPPPIPSELKDVEVVRALEKSRQLILKQPRSAAAWGQLGLLLIAHEYDGEAEKCLAEAERLNPADFRWPAYRGLLAQRYNLPSTESLLRRALQLGTPKIEYDTLLRFRLAEALVARGAFEEAAELYREVLEREPNNARANYGRGLIALAQEEASARDYLLAVRTSPFARKKALASLASHARVHGDAKAAEYEKEAASLPDDLLWPDPFIVDLFHLQVGLAKYLREAADLEKQGRFEEAARLLITLLPAHPLPKIYLDAGLDLGQAGRYDKALELLNEGARLDPNNARAHLCLAIVTFSQAEKASQSSPLSQEARDGFRSVIRHARRAVELKPDFAGAYLFWGRSLLFLGEPIEAISPLRKAVECHPEQIDLQLSLSEALLQAGKLAEASIHIEKARLLNPKDLRVMKMLEKMQFK